MRIILAECHPEARLFVMRTDDARLAEDDFRFVSCGRRIGDEYHAANGRVYRILPDGAVRLESR